MGNLQTRLTDANLAYQQDIQVERPRPISCARSPIATELLLDSHQAFKQPVRGEGRLQGDDCVRELGLIGKTDRCRAIER